MDGREALPAVPEHPLVVLPAADRAPVDGAADLLVAQRQDRALVALGRQHRGVERDAQQVADAPRVALRVVHQPLVDDRLVLQSQRLHRGDRVLALQLHHRADLLRAPRPRECG
ncbi:MAG: hypothetical protein ACK55I_19910, partial [bacterium]